MAIANTDSANANTVTFSAAIGGTTLAAVNVGANTTATFSSTVAATKITVSSANTTTFTGAVAGAVDVAADGTLAFGAHVVGAVDNTTGADGAGTITVVDTANVTGAMGATNTLKAVTFAGSTTMTGAISATTITGGSVGKTLAFADGDVTGNVVFAADVGASGVMTVTDGEKIIGNVTTLGATGTGTLTFATATAANVEVVSGDIGTSDLALKQVTLGAAATFTASTGGATYAATVITAGAGDISFGGTVTGTTLTLGGTGTQTLTDTATIATNFTAAGTLVTTAGKTLTGAITDGAIDATVTNAGTIVGDITLDGGAATITNSGTITGATLGGAGIDTLTNTGTVTGAIDLAAGANVFTNSGTITGAVAGGAGIDTFTMTAGTITGDVDLKGDGAADNVVAITGGTFNGIFDVGGNGGNTVTINPAAGATVSFVNAAAVALTSHAANTYTLSGAGTVKIDGNVTTTGGAATIAVSAGKLQFTGDSAITGQIDTTVAGTILDVTTKDVTVSAASAIGDATGTVFAVTIDNTAASSGSLATSGAVAITIDDAVKITPTLGTITSGTAYTIVDTATNGGTLTIATLATLQSNLVDNSARYNFTLDNTTTANNLLLTPTKVDATALGLSANATAIDTNANLAFASDAAMLTALNSIADATALNTALETLAPDVSGSAFVGTMNVMNSSLATVETRLAGLRDGFAGQTGFSSGDSPLSRAVWGQAFGSFAEQDKRKGIEGFESDTYGLAFGVDKQLDDTALTVGVAFSYADTDVDNKNSANNTDIQSYQGTIYGNYDAGQYFVDGSVAYASNDYDGERHIVVGAVNRIAKSSYDADQYSVKAGVGKDFDMDGFKVTPDASLQYTHLGLDGYTETNAGNANLVVKDKDFDNLNLGLGAKVAKKIKVANGTVVPEAHVGLGYDIVADKMSTTAKFAGGGAEFTTNGADVARVSYNVGAGVTFINNDNFDVTATYDFEGKSDYSSHTTVLRGRWKF